MPGQRPSWGRAVLSPPSAAILRGFCESRHAETCSAERVSALGERTESQQCRHRSVTVSTGPLREYPCAATPPLAAPPDPLPPAGDWSLTLPFLFPPYSAPHFPSPGNFELSF